MLTQVLILDRGQKLSKDCWKPGTRPTTVRLIIFYDLTADPRFLFSREKELSYIDERGVRQSSTFLTRNYQWDCAFDRVRE